MPITAPPPAAEATRYALTTTTGGAEVLMRVIGVIRRRCGEVVALDFHRGDEERSPVLEVVVAVDPRLASGLAARLAGLVEVIEVRAG